MMALSLRRHVKQYVWIVGSRAGAAVLQAVLLVVLARATDPGEFGSIMAVFGIGVVVQVSSELGMPAMILREHARARDPGLVAGALRINSGTSVTLAALGVGTLLLVGIGSGNSLFIMMSPLAVGLAAERFADTRMAISIADGRARLVAVTLTGRRSIALVVLLVGLALGVPPALGFAVSSLFAGLFAAWFASRTVRVPFADRTSVVQTLKRSSAYYVNSVSSQLRNLDVALLTLVAGAGQAGVYAVGSRIVGPFQMFVTSAASVALPAAARQKDSSRAAALKLILSASGVMAVGYLVVALSTAAWIPMLLGAEYAQAAAPVGVIVLALIPASFVELAKPVLQGWGEAKKVAWASGAGSVATLGLVVLGGSVQGAWGAAWGFLLGSVVIAALCGAVLTWSIKHRVSGPSTT